MSAAAAQSTLPSVDGHPLVETESQHVLKSYGRYPLVVEKGKGVYLYDDKGNKYLDFISGIGVTALGHAHPRILPQGTESRSSLGIARQQRQGERVDPERRWPGDDFGVHGSHELPQLGFQQSFGG